MFRRTIHKVENIKHEFSQLFTTITVENVMQIEFRKVKSKSGKLYVQSLFLMLSLIAPFDLDHALRASCLSARVWNKEARARISRAENI